MTRKKIKLDTEQRPFSIIYHDFFKSNLLDIYGKMTFIALKIFIDDNNQCFPSIKTLSKLTSISEKKIKTTLTELEKKGIITKKGRTRLDGGKSSNLYTIRDFKELWNADSNEKITMLVNEYEEKRLISELRSRGYTVIKEKEPTSLPGKVTDVSTKISDINKNITKKAESQDLERYTIEDIKQLFDYDIMIHDNPYQQQDIDSVMDILYTVLNTTKPNIRICGEDKPSMVVIGKLMKLNYESIMYAIKKFSEQTERIRNPVSYMLTMLYNAPEQFRLDIQNQVSHDMAHWNQLNKK